MISLFPLAPGRPRARWKAAHDSEPRPEDGNNPGRIRRIPMIRAVAPHRELGGVGSLAYRQGAVPSDSLEKAQGGWRNRIAPCPEPVALPRFGAKPRRAGVCRRGAA